MTLESSSHNWPTEISDLLVRLGYTYAILYEIIGLSELDKFNDVMLLF